VKIIPVHIPRPPNEFNQFIGVIPENALSKHRPTNGTKRVVQQLASRFSKSILKTHLGIRAEIAASVKETPIESVTKSPRNSGGKQILLRSVGILMVPVIIPPGTSGPVVGESV
jgi:hypothetical protein